MDQQSTLKEVMDRVDTMTDGLQEIHDRLEKSEFDSKEYPCIEQVDQLLLAAYNTLDTVVALIQRMPIGGEALDKLCDKGLAEEQDGKYARSDEG